MERLPRGIDSDGVSRLIRLIYESQKITNGINSALRLKCFLEIGEDSWLFCGAFNSPARPSNHPGLPATTILLATAHSHGDTLLTGTQVLTNTCSSLKLVTSVRIFNVVQTY